MLKKLVSCALCLSIVLSLCMPTLAVEPECKEHPCTCQTNYESLIPAALAPGDVVPLEDPNEECGISSHMPPSGYRYSGTKYGNTQIEDVTLTAMGWLVSAIVPDMGTLVFLISAGVALNPSTIAGDYTIYEWSNGTNTWQHCVVYRTYENASGQEVIEYATCEVRTS